MQKTLLVVFLVLSLTIMMGCISLPRELLSSAIETQELSDHVHFLARPALKGRKPRTWESATARRYVESRFKAYGLAPWVGRKGYGQPFGFGTNIIGVLPGSDPNLADEVVVLSAHYDHLGKTKKGVLLGACDNASGVAALLEIAEHLSMATNRPRRPVCFASFDCEETFTLGSFVFTCQPDFDKHRIAAMVNVDLLGRDFLDVVADSVFVVGTELYPGLREQILQRAAQAGIRVLPIGTDLIGPRGDHVAFETLEIPVLFFSCGLYNDYHKPTDTAEKLNYSAVKKSAELIASAIEVLANADDLRRLPPERCVDEGELRTFSFILERIESNYEQTRLNVQGKKAVQELAVEAKRLLDSGAYTAIERRHFFRKIAEHLLPTFAGANTTCARSREGLLWADEFYGAHRKALIVGFRKLVHHLLKDKPGPFGKVRFKYQAYDVGDGELSLMRRDDGQYELDAILTQMEMNFEMGGWLFKRPVFGFFGGGLSLEHFLGSREEMVSFCLLRWRENLKDDSYARAWGKILKAVTGEENGATYNDWLQGALEKQGWVDEKEWILNLREGDNSRLAYEAGAKMPKAAVNGTASELYQIIKDVNAPACTRVSAIWGLDNEADGAGLLALAHVLTDETPSTTKVGQPRFMDESYPFADHGIIRMLRKSWEKQHENRAGPRTIADDAQDKLRQLTGQNFGKDVKAWRKWIKAHVK
ncbi:MAG TPA: M28 family peptidase [Sedimentisphaerales bacterium]|nr:M28 family peptidase [Sedimentisphaerales bacterium]